MVDSTGAEEMADIVEFLAKASGHEASEKAGRVQAWQHPSDWQLADRLQMDRLFLLLMGGSS